MAIFDSLEEFVTHESGPRTLAAMLISLTGLALWFDTVSRSAVWWVNPDLQFGLFQLLPNLWIGIALYVFGMVLTVDRGSRVVFFLRTCLLDLMVWGAPILVESNPRQVDTWIHMASTRVIIDTGHLPISNTIMWQNMASLKLQYPGSFLFNAILTILSTLPWYSYYRIFPLISSTVFTLGLYVLFRRFSSDENVGRLSIILSLLINPWLLFHASPQAYGLMLLPMVLWAATYTARKYAALTMILFAGLVVSHPITSLFILLMICVIVAIEVTGVRIGASFTPYTVLNLGVVWLSWFVLNASFDFQGTINTMLQAGQVQRSISSISLQTRALIASDVRLVIIGITILVATSGLYMAYTREAYRRFAFATAWMIAAMAFVLLEFVGFGGDFRNRGLMFLFMIVPFILIGSTTDFRRLHKYRRIAAIILILLLSVQTFSYYNSENDLLVSNTNMASASFLVAHHSSQVIVSNYVTVMFFYGNPAPYLWLTFSLHERIPRYFIIIIDRFTLTRYDEVGNRMRQLNIQYGTEIGSNRVYDNSQFETYDICEMS